MAQYGRGYLAWSKGEKGRPDNTRYVNDRSTERQLAAATLGAAIERLRTASYQLRVTSGAPHAVERYKLALIEKKMAWERYKALRDQASGAPIAPLALE